MNVLFLSIVGINNIEERGIYPDLIRKFIEGGHNVTVLTPFERKEKSGVKIMKADSYELIQVKTLNLTKSNVIEKGVGILALNYQFMAAIKKYCNTKKFDLVVYSTPPITISNVINYIKRRDNAVTYLLLKDIFPQNVVDLNILRKDGLLHRYFKRKEKQLYTVSDYIGCMSKANVDYLLKNYPYISSKKLEVNPNTIEPLHIFYSELEKQSILKKYNLPTNKKIFVYGGNLGKAQGLDFLLETIESVKSDMPFFVIIGTGTEYIKILNWLNTYKPHNAKLIDRLPKLDYDLLLAACDVGLVFLDKSFTVPNFPSRILSYMEMKMPMIVATDSVSDVGDVIEEAKCGYKVRAGDLNGMQKSIDAMCTDSVTFEQMRNNSWSFLLEKFTVETSYKVIMNRMPK